MKTILYAFTALLMMTCGSSKIEQTTTLGAKSRSTAIKKGEGPFTDAERVGKIMNYLASDELKGRDSGSEGIEMAANT